MFVLRRVLELGFVIVKRGGKEQGVRFVQQGTLHQNVHGLIVEKKEEMYYQIFVNVIMDLEEEDVKSVSLKLRI